MMFYGLHRLIIDNLIFVVYPKLGIKYSTRKLWRNNFSIYKRCDSDCIINDI